MISFFAYRNLYYFSDPPPGPKTKRMDTKLQKPHSSYKLSNFLCGSLRMDTKLQKSHSSYELGNIHCGSLIVLQQVQRHIWWKSVLLVWYNFNSFLHQCMYIIIPIFSGASSQVYNLFLFERKILRYFCNIKKKLCFFLSHS